MLKPNFKETMLIALQKTAPHDWKETRCSLFGK